MKRVQVPMFAGVLVAIQFCPMPSEAGDNCVPPKEVVTFAHKGQYHRIHPSGNYFMFTDGQGSTIVNVMDREKPVVIQTPMREESYPVEGGKGGWELIASPVKGGGHGPNGGMDYFAFNELAEQAKSEVKPTYTDREHGEYYHSSAELPGSTDKVKKVRTLLYSNRIFRDYEMKMTGEGKVESARPGKKGNLCENVFARVSPSPEAKKKYEAAQAKIRRLETEFYQKSAPEADRRALHERLREMRRTAENEFYGPAYTANRTAAALVREKYEAATNEFQARPEYIAANQAIEDAHNQHNKTLRSIEATAEIGEFTRKRTALEAEYRLPATTAERRRALEVEYRQVEQAQSQAIQKMRNESPLVREAKQKIETAEKTMAAINESPESLAISQLRRDIGDLDTERWQYIEGKKLSNPVLSKDGTQVAGLVNGKIEVFQIDGAGDCTSIVRTEFRGSKVSFSYPQKDKPLQITFTAEGGATGKFRNRAYVYDLSSGQATMISSADDGDTSYPGFTLDGRVMYKTSMGMAIVDPLQIANNGCTSSAAAAAGKATQHGGTKR